MKDSILAYIAGFLEGDGSIVLCRCKSGRLDPRISIVQRNPAILYAIQKYLGVGKVREKKGGSWSPPGYRYYTWYVSNRDDVNYTLSLLAPFFFTEKSRKAKLILRFTKSVPPGGASTYLTQNDKKLRREIWRNWLKIAPSIKSKIPEILPTLAGFVDADGCVYKQKDGRLRVIVGQKRREVLDCLRDNVGGYGSVNTRKVMREIGEVERRFEMSCWSISNREFIEQLNPYLKIKRKKI